MEQTQAPNAHLTGFETSMRHLRNLFFLGPQTCLAGACFCAITLGKTAVSSMLFRYFSLFLRSSSLFELELGPRRHHRELEIYTKIDVCTAPAPTKAEPLVQTLTYAQSVSLLLLLILCCGMEGFHKHLYSQRQNLSLRLIYVN